VQYIGHSLCRCAGSFWECLIGGHCGFPRQTEDPSFGDHLIQWVSQCYAFECYRSVILFCSVLCLYGSCEIQFRTFEFSFLIVLWKKKLIHKSCRRKYHHKFPNTTCPSADTISKLVKRVWTNSILIDRKPLKINCVLSEEKLDDFGCQSEKSPPKSLRRLALQRGVSVSRVSTATKLLHIHPL
jgi:hypothetical protein